MPLKCSYMGYVSSPILKIFKSNFIATFCYVAYNYFEVPICADSSLSALDPHVIHEGITSYTTITRMEVIVAKGFGSGLTVLFVGGLVESRDQLPLRG